MIAVKDGPSASIVFPGPEQDRKAHAPNVVLDLDYTIVIPKIP